MNDIELTFFLLVLYLFSFIYIIVPRDFSEKEENVSLRQKLEFTINNGTYASRECPIEIPDYITFATGVLKENPPGLSRFMSLPISKRRFLSLYFKV